MDFQPPDRRGEPVACPIGIGYWNTIYTQLALDELAHQSAPHQLAGLTPALFEHVNALGTYTFNTHRWTAPAPPRTPRRLNFH